MGVGPTPSLGEVVTGRFVQAFLIIVGKERRIVQVKQRHRCREGEGIRQVGPLGTITRGSQEDGIL